MMGLSVMAFVCFIAAVLCEKEEKNEKLIRKLGTWNMMINFTVTN